MICLWKVYSMTPKYIICQSCIVQKEERTAQRHTCISVFLHKSRTHAFTALLYQIRWFKLSFNATVVDISVWTSVIRQTSYRRCSDIHSAQTISVVCGFFYSSLQDLIAVFKSSSWFGTLVHSWYREEDNICLAIDIVTLFYLTAVAGHPLA